MQALADSGASGEEIAKTLKETFAKAMREDPSAAADLARTMAVALAAAGASAEDIAETMKEALSAGLNLGDGASPDDILDVVETVARDVCNCSPILGYLINMQINLKVKNFRDQSIGPVDIS